MWKQITMIVLGSLLVSILIATPLVWWSKTKDTPNYLVVERSPQGNPFQCWVIDTNPIAYAGNVFAFRTRSGQVVRTKANVIYVTYDKGQLENTKQQIKLKFIGETP